MGAFFEALVIAGFVREMATYRWHPAAATIETSGVAQNDDDEEPYRLAATYRYSYDGVERVSSQVALSPRTSSSYDNIQRDAIELAPGSTTTCYVDPNDPQRSVLLRRSPAMGLVALFPLIFVAVGAVGLYAVWKPPAKQPVIEVISNRASSRNLATTLPIVLGLLFIAVGGGLFIAIGVVPGARLLAARSWLETPCTIISSTVRSHSTDDDTSYRVDILFQYEIDAVPYRSNRYDFLNFGSSGYDSKREIVDRYPEGSSAVCFVDPDDPTRAVLVRDFSPAYLVGLFPLLFAVVGAAVARLGFNRRNRAPKPWTAPGDFGYESSSLGRTNVLAPKQSPVAKVLGAVIFAFLWNGIVSVFLVNVIRDWQRGQHAWGTVLFLTPFVLVGLASIVMVGYTVLAAFNPRPSLRVEPTTPALGDSVAVEWKFAGRSRRIEHLQIVIEGREEAAYRRGKNSRTDTEVFARIRVADAHHGLEIARGSGHARIPDDTMHSFSGGHNRVVWVVKLHGEIPNWPDVNEEFEITVRPLPAQEIRR